jgi:hypothetical protein
MQRHGWSKDTLDLIAFDVIGRIRKQLKWTDKTRTMKVLHGWLVVMHNMGKRNGITQCPGCPCEDETYLHLFSCKHSLMVKAISESLQNLHEGGRGAGQLPRAFIDRFISYIEAGIRKERATVPSEGPLNFEWQLNTRIKSKHPNSFKVTWPYRGQRHSGN